MLRAPRAERDRENGKQIVINSLAEEGYHHCRPWLIIESERVLASSRTVLMHSVFARIALPYKFCLQATYVMPTQAEGRTPALKLDSQ